MNLHELQRRIRGNLEAVRSLSVGADHVDTLHSIVDDLKALDADLEALAVEAAGPGLGLDVQAEQASRIAYATQARRARNLARDRAAAAQRKPLVDVPHEPGCLCDRCYVELIDAAEAEEEPDGED